jgi:hypothetical protein
LAADTLPISPEYPLAEVYAQLVLRARELAPAGLAERWGVCHFHGHPDFRLSLGRYRVVGMAPLATRVTVFMEWRRVLGHPEQYGSSPDFAPLAAAWQALPIRNLGQPWNSRDLGEVGSQAATDLLACGMRLMVTDLRRRHPETIAAP